MNNFNNQQNNQNNPCEWLKFIPTHGEKHLGVAIIRYDRRFILRFKVMPSENGGYWIVSPSLKTGNVSGKDKYEPAFSLDSEYEKSTMTDYILACLEREPKLTNDNTINTQQTQSIYGSQQIQQQKNNFSQQVQDENIPF